MTTVAQIEISFGANALQYRPSDVGLVPYINGPIQMKSVEQGVPTKHIRFEAKSLLHCSKPIRPMSNGVYVDEKTSQERQEREVWCGSVTGLSDIPEPERNRICCKFVRGSAQIHRVWLLS